MSEAIIPTLPDVKMCAAKAIARSARSGMYIISALTHNLVVVAPFYKKRFVLDGM